MVAYYFPPLGGIASIRAMTFARYLPEWGWTPVVLASAGSSQRRDDSLALDVGTVTRARTFEAGQLGPAIVGDPPAGPSTGSRGLLRRSLRVLAHRYLYWPDPQVGWYPSAVRAGRKMLRLDKFDAIFSSSVPITAHLVARTLHRESGIPWVAEFRDPWADVVLGDGQSERRDRLERSFLRESAAVVTVSPSWKARFLEKGAARAYVITNGFDPDEVSVRPASGFVVTHLGSVYPGLQDLRAVWEALARWRAAEPAQRLSLRFVGDVDDRLRREISGYGLSDILEVTGFLGHRAALDATAASSALITAGFHPDHPLYRGVIPAKLFEYLGTGLPILYIGGPETDAARILATQPGCHVIGAADVEGALSALLAARQEGWCRRDLVDFSRLALAHQLADVLESVRP